jgi:hypothetical protein
VAYGEYQVVVPMGYYLQKFLGEEYCAITLTTTDNHTAEMEIDISQPVGFKIMDKPLKKINNRQF